MQCGPAKRIETDHCPLVFKAVLEEGEGEEAVERAGPVGPAPAAAGAGSARKRSAVVDANQQVSRPVGRSVGGQQLPLPAPASSLPPPRVPR